MAEEKEIMDLFYDILSLQKFDYVRENETEQEKITRKEAEEEEIEKFMAERGSELNNLDYLGRSILHIACYEKCSPWVVEVALRYGADPLIKSSDTELTPLHYFTEGYVQ